MTDIVTPSPIAPLPPPPLLTDPQSVFNTRAFAFVGALPDFAAQINSAGGSANQNATAAHERALAAASHASGAQTAATAAASARDQAQVFAVSAVNAPGTSGTSASWMEVSAGAKYCVTQPGKAWTIGQCVNVASAGLPAAMRMFGVITGYNASNGDLTFNVSGGAFTGSGADVSWVISLSAARDGLVSQGSGIGQTPNRVHIGWSAEGRLKVTVDATDLGPVVFDTQLREGSPPGQVGFFATTWAPAGWLKANGAAVSRTAFASLFSVIGTYYGAGDGVNTFNLPDMRGMFARGWDDARGVDPSRILGSYQAPANMSHAHAASDSGHAHTGWTDVRGSHAHGVNDPGHTHAAQGSAGDLLTGGGGVPRAHTGTVTTTPSATGIWLDAGGAHDHAVGVGTGYASIYVAPDGASESRPHNVAFLACIRY